MYTCSFCNLTINEAFVGSKNETKIYSCFKCFIKTLKPFKFDEELVYYPLLGIRDIQIGDHVVFYDKDGQELAKVYLDSYEEGFLSHLKEEITRDLEIAAEDISLVIEPFGVQLKG